VKTDSLKALYLIVLNYSWNVMEKVEPLFHPQTAAALQRFLQSPAHAIGLIGPPGAGKRFTAQYLARHVLGMAGAEAIRTIIAEKNSISIEQIRGIQQFLRLKVPGTAAVKRVVIIEDAGLMGAEAQNALLKMLEEPPADTIFILTTDSTALLKPTIISRLQKFHILPITLDQATTLADVSETELRKAYHLSGGYCGLLFALLQDKEHRLVQAVEEAKKLVKASTYTRLQQIDSLAKEKEQLPQLLYALQRVLGAVLAQTTDKIQLQRLTARLRAVYEAEHDLAHNANTKLVLTDLFLHL